MLLSKAQIQSWADFQPEPIPRHRVEGKSVLMWLLAASMVILLAIVTVHGIGG